MADNTVPCGECSFYDPILTRGNRQTKRGWCIKRSLYPDTPGPHQIIPPGAQHAQPGDPAEPFIVHYAERQPQCTFVVRSPINAVTRKQQERIRRISPVNRQGRHRPS